MKKILVLALALVMIFAITATVSAKEPIATINVPKCTTAPTIDGAIASGEYKLVASFDKNGAAWSRDTQGVEDLDVKLDVYATWDDTYFYYAVKVSNHEPNYTPGPNSYVFEQPSIMTAMVYDDPTLAVFAAADGKDWDWGAAYAASFAREWTIGSTKEGVDFEAGPCNHFGAVRSNADYKFKVTHGDFDIYEQAIPWAAIGKTTGIEVGGKAGLAFSAVVKSVEGAAAEDYQGGYVAFASGIVGGKSFERYGLVNLTANEPFETEESEVETSKDESQTPPTGDGTAIFAVVSMIAIAGAAIVVSKKRR